MKVKSLIGMCVLVCAAFAFACSRNSEVGNSRPSAPLTPAESPAALPDGAFKAEVTLIDPPAKLRTGQKENLRVKIKNVSEVAWWARGGPVNTRSDNKFYLATGNRWLKPDGSLLTNMDGRHGIGKDLQPGEETEVPLAITAPKEPGEYTLEVDLIQEQVAWFSDKGSPTAKTKITVVR